MNGEVAVHLFTNGGRRRRRRANAHREYATQLKIKPLRLDDRKIIDIEILSERGEIPEVLGLRAHLHLMLVADSRPSENVVLYQIAAALFNPKPTEQLKHNGDAPPVAASLMKIGDGVVLQIVSDKGFVDVLHFQGREVTKGGSLTWDNEEGMIHWAESLVQEKPVVVTSIDRSFPVRLASSARR